jgi:hypothetical protein
MAHLFRGSSRLMRASVSMDGGEMKEICHARQKQTRTHDISEIQTGSASLDALHKFRFELMDT